MTRLAALSLAIPLLTGSAAFAQPAPPAGPLPSSVISELPRNARPSHYSISVAPDAAALKFSGAETIDLELYSPSRTIVLNASKLEIDSASLAPAAGGAATTLTSAIDEAHERVTFTAPNTIPAGAYRLSVAYRGRINNQPSGLFALDYPDKRTGKTVRGLFTQFESPDAREFAPMFDEPSYKATFDLSAIVPDKRLAVSNMRLAREEPLGNGLKRVNFATTPRMSSYLLLFAVGDFERQTKRSSSGTEVGIVAPAGSGASKQYALDALTDMVPYYNAYFGVPYPLPKIDDIAAPGQSQTFGGMENWGAILMFEKYLLLDPRNTSPTIQNYLYTSIAHEFAHQWFGDLVTMAWWDDLWLNEGFASWFQTKATDHFHPDWFELIGRVPTRERAMEMDSLSSTHPVVVPIRTVAEADSAFDAISYSKGETIIAMLEAYAGEDTWRDGVRRYLAAHAYGSAVTADLWRAEEHAGVPRLAAIADSFTRQPGVPLVSVQQRCLAGRTVLSLVQGQFSSDRRAAVAKAPLHWLVPLTIRAADGSLHRQLLDRRAQVTLPGCGAVIVNGGQLGYFRTLYQPAALARLTAVIPTLNPTDQLGLMQDNLALAAASYQDFAPALELLSAIPANANPVVAKYAIGAWVKAYAQLHDSAANAKLASLAHEHWFGRLQQVGYDPRRGESLADTELRSSLLAAFGQMADPAVLAEARRRFALLKTDRKALDGPLKTTWLSIVSRNATPDDWELLRTLGRTAPTEVEKTVYYTLLGNAIDDTLARRALELALTDEPGATTSAAMVATVSGPHADMAFDFAIAHEPQVLAMLDDYSKADFIPDLAATSIEPAMLAKLEALRERRPETQRKAVDEQLAALRQRLEAIPRTRSQLQAWLPGKAG